MEATAAPHHSSAPIDPEAPTSPMHAAAAPRARITLFFSGFTPLTGTGTATPAVPQAPTTGTSTGEAPEALAAASNASATGPDTPAAAPESPATTTPTSGETMPPGESHEWQDNDWEALFTEPPKKKGERTYGRLELKPPDFEIQEFGGGPHRKRHSLEFKLNAIDCAQSVVPGGKGPGGTVGQSYRCHHRHCVGMETQNCFRPKVCHAFGHTLST